MNIGITGSIACGKSTVTSYLAKKGYKVIDADKIGHSILFKDEVKNKLVEVFGKNILENGEISRLLLGKLVFGDSKKLEKLNSIVHPAIKDEVKKLQTEYKDEKLVFLDVALLFEAKFDDYVEKSIVVYTDEELQLKRLMTRNNFSEEEALKRIRSQMSSLEKAKLGNYIINNNKGINETYKQVDEIIEKVLKGEI